MGESQADIDKKDPNNVKLEGNADFKGPGDKRGCTDVLCAILIIAMWISMTGIGLIVTGFIENDKLEKGEPARLINGMDYNANICGIDNKINAQNVSIKDLPKAYYLPSGSPVCIAECPTADDYEKFHCKYQEGAYIEKKALESSNYEETKYTMSAYYSTTYACMPYVETRDIMGYCMPEALIDAALQAAADALNDKLKRECSTDDIDDGYINPDTEVLVPNDSDYGLYWKKWDGEADAPMNCTMPRKGIKISANFLDPATEDGFFDRIGADVTTSQNYILGFGLGVAMFLGFIYLFLLRIPGVLATMVWGLIFAVFVCLFGIGGMGYMKAEAWKEEGTRKEEEIMGMLYMGYFFLGCSAFWAFFICCCIRKQIILAIACVKEAAKAVAAMPIITVYPVFQVIGVLIFLIPWMTYVTYLASSGEVVANCICPDMNSLQNKAVGAYNMGQMASGGEKIEIEKDCEEGCLMYKTFTYDANTKLAGLYLLFCWFWTSQFIIAAGQLVVAMSVSMWYFTKDKKTVGNGTFFKAAKKAMWYHLGSAAFGSLIIAIIKTIRAVVAYLQNKAKKSKYAKVAQAVLCALQCYLWCVEKCMKFLNKNAYIQIAIFGYSFCKAAKCAFFLILRNILRISAVAIVSTFVLIIGKVFIMTATTILAYMAMASALDGELNYLWFPTILIAMVSYFTAEMFNEVFGMAISTILQCFVADEEMFPNPADRFAEGDLAQTINRTNKAAADSGVGAGAAAVHPEEKYDTATKSDVADQGSDLP